MFWPIKNNFHNPPNLCTRRQIAHIRVFLKRNQEESFWAVWRIQNVLMQIWIPLFKLMRIWIRIHQIQILLLGWEIFFFKSSTMYCFQSLPKLVSVIFSVRMQEEEWGVRDNGWGIKGEGWGARDEGRGMREEGWWRKGEEAVKRCWGGRVRRKGEGEWERKDDILGRRENWRGMRDEGGEMRDME